MSYLSPLVLCMKRRSLRRLVPASCLHRASVGLHFLAALVISGLVLAVTRVEAFPSTNGAILFPGSVKTTHENNSIHSANLPLIVSFFDPDIHFVKSSFYLSVDGVDRTNSVALKPLSLGMRLTSPLSLERCSLHHYIIVFEDDSKPAQRYYYEAFFQTDTRGPGDFVMELEDFNYAKGKFKQDANVMPYAGLAYDGQSGASEIDYHVHEAGDGPTNNYRDGENPNVPLLPTRERERSGFLVDGSYLLAAGTNDWFQYTRVFPTNYYDVYAALSSGSLGEGRVVARLYLSEDAHTNNPPIHRLGTFNGISDGGWGINTLIPLVSVNGTDNAILYLGGTNTLRFESETGLGDYLLFVPTERVGSVHARLKGANRLDPGRIVISWEGNGALLQADDIQSTFRWIDGIDKSPVEIQLPASDKQRFFKVIPRKSATAPILSDND